MPKSAALKNISIDVADILGSEISVNIDIGNGDPPSSRPYTYDSQYLILYRIGNASNMIGLSNCVRNPRF